MIVVTNSLKTLDTLAHIRETVLRPLSGDDLLPPLHATRTVAEAVAVPSTGHALVLDLAACSHESDLLTEVSLWRMRNRGLTVIVFYPNDDVHQDLAVSFMRLGLKHVFPSKLMGDAETWNAIYSRSQFEISHTLMQNKLVEEVRRQHRVFYHQELFLHLLAVAPKTNNATEAARLLFAKTSGAMPTGTKNGLRVKLYRKLERANALPAKTLLDLFRLLYSSYFHEYNRAPSELHEFLNVDYEQTRRHVYRTLGSTMTEVRRISFAEMLTFVAKVVTSSWPKEADCPTTEELLEAMPKLPQVRRRGDSGVGAGIALAAIASMVMTTVLPSVASAAQFVQEFNLANVA